jgi:hypothetical protein
MVGELLIIGEVDHASFANAEPRRHERPLQLAYLEFGADGGTRAKPENNDGRKNAHR